MSAADSVIVVASLAGVVILGGWLATRQRATADYYLAGRRLPAWALGISLAANQASAISLVGAPAFVALREGGGLRWLQYEMAVPLAMAALVLWGVPFLRRAPGSDIYAAVEERLGKAPRRALAVLFLAGRGAGAGVILYASSLVVATVTGWSSGASLLVVGGVAVAYTTLGGLAADVATDVLQFGLLWGGTLIAGTALTVGLARQGPLLQGVDPDRLAALDLTAHGLGDGATFAFWPMLVGGFFLYLSYYGCDQTQAQRILAAGSTTAARQALAVAALVRFPLVLTYCVFGVALAALLAHEPAFAARLAGRPADALVPEFLAFAVPSGVRGLAVAGILAAALSSVDSALNSLSAVTLEELGGHHRLWLARLSTLAWGALAVVAAAAFARSGETTIEMVNRVGSALYGPILALFLVAWRRRALRPRAVAAAAAGGVAANLLLAWLAPSVSWLWWNPSGLIVTLALALPFTRPTGEPVAAGGQGLAVRLLVLFAAVLAVLALITVAARS